MDAHTKERGGGIMNNLSIIIMTIWISAAIGSIGNKNFDPFDEALIATVLIGLGYFIVKY